MASRDLHDLTPDMARRAEDFLGFAQDEGMDVLIYCTYRSFEEQARTYRVGRSYQDILRKADQMRAEGWTTAAAILLGVGPQHGPRPLTHAAPGQSPHQYGLAFDGVPIVNGQALWNGDDPRTAEDDKLWDKYGKLVEQAGLVWGAHFHSVDKPHAEIPGFDYEERLTEWERQNARR